MTKSVVHQYEHERHDDINKKSFEIGMHLCEKNQQCIECHYNNLIHDDACKKNKNIARAPYPIDWSGM